MRLTQLEPQFVKRLEAGSFRHVDALADADGIYFVCPICFVTNGGLVGSHSILCWRPTVPLDEFHRGPARWQFHGTGYADLTLSPSVLLPGDDGCKAHFFVRAGEIISCG